MADTINKPKLQLRAAGVTTINGDKTPSPATKLLISHGKPNFTIQRSPKEQQNGDANPLSPIANESNNYNPYKSANSSSIVVKSTKFNGVFSTSSISVTSKQAHQQQQSENEASKVVLRRAGTAKVSAVPPAEGDEDDSVPEFIRRQRRIQERLAKEDLDFENRRSGYFTHVIVSPTSTNRQSFVETMSSPAVVPSLELPPPASPVKKEATVFEEDERVETEEQVEKVAEELVEGVVEKAVAQVLVAEEAKHETQQHVEAAVTPNGDSISQIEEEEVAKAIEEVNKAVAGEDDEKTYESEAVTAAAATLDYVEPTVTIDEKIVEVAAPPQVEEVTTAEVRSAAQSAASSSAVEESVVTVVTTTSSSSSAAHFEELAARTTSYIEELHKRVDDAEHREEQPAVTAAVVTAIEVVAEVPDSAPAVEIQQNGHHIEVIAQEPLATQESGQTNGHHSDGVNDDDITISHTNGIDGTRISSTDPNGAVGVNYEPKTVVSFSKDLGSEINKYPDTVKVVTEGEVTPVDSDLQDLAKLKFEIKTDDKDVQVTPVLRTE